ncbi:hypothetical protein [Hyunsoonleella pacifica]|uniref:hypothetical protein n=1 Tax=Hyunsoonleella pacifica TaxID=1080224 RepID=UPI0013EF56A8|nr:hypothetical protein [Hyunsoonleella pacifica]GGD15515.1 hypothetical protein GCM10011368_16830 [Hyunsoonleella pacifica]
MLLNILQTTNIEEKLKEAPDSSYEIGVFLGSMIPFVVLVIIAYMIYYYNKKRNSNT